MLDVQTIAPPPNTLDVVKDAFEALPQHDRRRLLDSGVVRRKESTVQGAQARVNFTHARKPAARMRDIPKLRLRWRSYAK